VRPEAGSRRIRERLCGRRKPAGARAATAWPAQCKGSSKLASVDERTRERERDTTHSPCKVDEGRSLCGRRRRPARLGGMPIAGGG